MIILLDAHLTKVTRYSLKLVIIQERIVIDCFDKRKRLI